MKLRPKLIPSPFIKSSDELRDLKSNNSIQNSALPKFSIITPSYNQGKFLEDTIQSVLQQKYPNIEYIVIDGGSSDRSVEIIKKYEKEITYWVSEPDRGQAHAINKGFAQATGDIMAWINSDDFYAPNAFMEVAKTALQHSEELWFAGRCDTLENGRIKKNNYLRYSHTKDWYRHCLLSQPGVFWRKKLWQECGGLDENFHYSFDYDLWLNFAAVQPLPIWIDAHLATYRSHTTSKTAIYPERFFIEDQKVILKHASLWEGKLSKRRMRFLDGRRKANHLLHIASITNLTSTKIELIFRAIRTSPSLIFHPYYYFVFFKLIFGFSRKPAPEEK